VRACNVRSVDSNSAIHCCLHVHGKSALIKGSVPTEATPTLSLPQWWFLRVQVLCTSAAHTYNVEQIPQSARYQDSLPRSLTPVLPQPSIPQGSTTSRPLHSSQHTVKTQAQRPRYFYPMERAKALNLRSKQARKGP